MDATQPSTTIQIRLSDGSRLTGRFNLSHTIADLRLFITTYVNSAKMQFHLNKTIFIPCFSARPQYAAEVFSLLTTFPNKELTDAEQTIQGAGIMNSAITQRLK